MSFSLSSRVRFDVELTSTREREKKREEKSRRTKIDNRIKKEVTAMFSFPIRFFSFFAPSARCPNAMSGSCCYHATEREKKIRQQYFHTRRNRNRFLLMCVIAQNVATGGPIQNVANYTLSHGNAEIFYHSA